MFSSPHRPARTARAWPPLRDVFGVRSAGQVLHDLRTLLAGAVTRTRFQFDVHSLGLLRPDLSLPAYAGLVPADGLAPVYNLFDRGGVDNDYTTRVSRGRARDFRGGRLSYDDHPGTDFVCPIATPLKAAAPGVVVMHRRRWLRGALTVAVDHGGGLLTQYSHLSRSLVELGQPVTRGETVGLSGAAGYDLLQFFPWVPPHVHFMVFYRGRPVDPFLADGERFRPGCWRQRNDPRPEGALAADTVPRVSAVYEPRLRQLVAACSDQRIRAELERCPQEPQFVAALLEDALQHDPHAFPRHVRRQSVRPRDEREGARDLTVGLSLPLPAEDYCGFRFADTALTRPRAGR